MKLKTVRRSHRKEKKFDAVFVQDNGREKVVPFGARKNVNGKWVDMSDFTKHRDVTRKNRYLNRHSGMGEHWNKPDTPGALSRWVLWNKPTLKASISDFKKRFKL